MHPQLLSYLDNLSTEDSAFNEVYDKDFLSDCETYINSQARKLYEAQEGKKSGVFCLSDTEVFKMARDFFFDELENVKRRKEEEKNKAKEKEELSEEEEFDEICSLDDKPKKKEKVKELSLFDFD